MMREAIARLVRWFRSRRGHLGTVMASMTELNYLAYRRCTVKRYFRNETRAETIAEMMREKYSDPWLVAYECSECGGWHIGHDITGRVQPVIPRPKQPIRRPWWRRDDQPPA